MKSKEIAFIAIMSALGLTLSALSLNLAPILSSVGQGGAALDLSHIATFIAAIFGGPYVGALVAFIGGIYAGYYFGFVLGSLGLLSLIGVPFGKALTGLTAGFLYRWLGVNNRKNSSLLTVAVVLLSYVPECIYTTVYFLYIVSLVYGYGMSFMIPIVIPKAWIEIIVMSIMMGGLVGNIGFKEFMLKFFTPQGSKRAY